MNSEDIDLQSQGNNLQQQNEQVVEDINKLIESDVSQNDINSKQNNNNSENPSSNNLLVNESTIDVIKNENSRQIKRKYLTLVLKKIK